MILPSFSHNFSPLCSVHPNDSTDSMSHNVRLHACVLCIHPRGHASAEMWKEKRACVCVQLTITPRKRER